MISTITTSIITTVALAGSLTLAGILVLLVLLVQKELSSGTADPRVKALSKHLNVGIVPLLIVFVLVVFYRIAEMLR